MATIFGIKRGYVNGNKIFIATLNDKNYKYSELDKLSEDVLKVFDTSNNGGIFNPATTVTFKFGTTEKEFTFSALDLYTDTQSQLETKILARFQAIMAWKVEMNTSEEFNLNF